MKMIILFFIKQELSIKKLILLLISPIFLNIINQNNILSTIQYFEAILPIFFLWLFFDLISKYKDLEINILEEVTVFRKYFLFLFRFMVNICIYLAGLLYNMLVYSILFKMDLNMQNIIIEGFTFGKVSVASLLISSVVSTMFLAIIMNVLQILFNLKWTPLILTLCFAVYNLVRPFSPNIFAIYNYGVSWFYFKRIYLGLIIIINILLFYRDNRCLE